MIEYQGDKLDGLIKSQETVEQNADKTNEELEEAASYQRKYLQKTCVIASVIFTIGLLILIFSLVKFK